VDTDRKRVAIQGDSKAFSRALRLVLDDHDVELVHGLDDISSGFDLLVLQAAGELSEEMVHGAAEMAPTLVVADHDGLIDAVDAGCRGFLPSSSSLEEIRNAVDTILEGGAVVPPDLLGALLRHIVDRRRKSHALYEKLSDLTDRERQVFRLAARGARKEEIGNRLFISPATARTHLQRVYRKLGVHSQSELMAMAARMEEPEAEL
jgi:DNA-binding CsgD family transcriptional regulator